MDNFVGGKSFLPSLALIAFGFACILHIVRKCTANGPPIVGNWSMFEPRMVSSHRFFRSAESILREGYEKFSGRAFQVRVCDSNRLVLPPRHVQELRSLPSHVANSTLGNARNLFGDYTNMNIALEGNVHLRTLQSKFTPNLSALTRSLVEELEHSVKQEMPQCGDEWVAFAPFPAMLRLVAQISSRVLIGRPLCRDERWLKISMTFTKSVFESVAIFRMAPKWMHWTMSKIMPASRSGHRSLQEAKDLLGPEIRRRQSALAYGQKSKADSDVLTWMIELGRGKETDPDYLAHLELALSLGSLHTSQMCIVHVLYDLAAHPEYLEPILNEICQVIKEHGDVKDWSKLSFAKLRLLDSIMRESQRVNPPSLLSMHRVMLQRHQLKDGTVLPKNAHVCMAVSEIQNDRAFTSNPEVFDGFRYFEERQREGHSHLHQFSTTEEHVLNFGHGTHSCPGRFFASLEIKLILVHFLLNYDFRFPTGQSRPANLTAHEFVCPNPHGKLLIRVRRPKA